MLSLAEENDFLREQVRQLRSLLSAPDERSEYGRKLGINGKLLELFGLLMKHEIVSREMVFTAMYSTQADVPDEKIVDVMMCKLRQKLFPHAIKISVRYLVGWYISPEHKKLIKELCA